MKINYAYTVGVFVALVIAAATVTPIDAQAAKLKETVLEANKDNKRYFREIIARVRGEVCEPKKIVLHGERTRYRVLYSVFCESGDEYQVTELPSENKVHIIRW
tara:strand:- start:4055 stop:4366 length:312 start_codon:yes stop_codon:yes gene_type:complete